MRPRRLRLSGFGSFRDETDLDLDGIDYFALVGPTGHGKSTLIDAIGFALYGQVPRYDDARVEHQVVSLGAQIARVELSFDIGDASYVVTRIVKLRNGKPSQEGRLERVFPDGTTESLAGSVRELRPTVEALLGLPFEHFTRCVVLPQGAFQRFLHDKPNERRAVLVRLLNLEMYEQLGKRARELAREHEIAADLDERRLLEFAGATKEAHATAKARHGALTELHAAVAAARPVEQTLQASIAAALAAAERAEQFERALTTVAVPDAVARLGAARTEAQERLDALDETLAIATARREEAKKLADDYDVDELRSLAAGHEQVGRDRAALAAAEIALTDATDIDRRAQTVSDNAELNLTTAEARVREVQVAHSAHALVSELHEGEPCPVCRQTVSTVPEADDVPDVAAAEAAYAEAKQLVKQAQRATKQTAGDVASAHARADELRERVAQGVAAISAHPDAGALHATLEAAIAARATAETADRQEREANAALRDARAAIDHLDKQLDGAEGAYTRQRESLLELGPPAKQHGDLVANWNALAGWAAAQVDEQRSAASAARDAADAAALERRTLASGLIERAAALELAAPETLAELDTAVVRAEAHAQHAVEQIATQRKQARAVEKDVATQRAAQRVAAELGRLLKSDHFIQWLVDEAFATLVDGASTLLLSLSNGAYSLRLDDAGEFVVVDHANAGETRSVRTLSGGETFQAALALALALSDQLSSLAAQGAPRLEAIFLDEGFGSLDPESLDVVASSIEALGTSGRMVGIVTHVRELAERVPVRFEVQKVGRSSRVEMVTS
jgi:exonuclease SbcC